MYQNSNVTSQQRRLAYNQETPPHDYPQMEAMQAPPSPNLAAASSQQLMILHHSKVQHNLENVNGSHFQFLKFTVMGQGKKKKVRLVKYIWSIKEQKREHSHLIGHYLSSIFI
jgi:hypothetical protein